MFKRISTSIQLKIFTVIIITAICTNTIRVIYNYNNNISNNLDKAQTKLEYLLDTVSQNPQKAQEILKNKDPQVQLNLSNSHCPSPITNKDIVSATRYLEASHVCLTLSYVKKDVIINPATKRLITDTSRELSFTIIYLIITYLITENIVKPIKALSQTVASIGEGNACLITHTNSQDEIGQLSRAFNHMVEKIDKISQLEVDAEILRKRQQDLEQVNKELQRINKLKSDFIGNVNHELRTPLTSIRMYNQLILDGRLGTTTLAQQDALKEIIAAADHLTNLINTLLQAKKIEEGKVDYQFGIYNIIDIFNTAKANLQGLINQKGIEIILEAESLPPFKLDKNQIVNVFINLIGNAIKFNRDRNPLKIIIRSIERDGRAYCVIQVIDQGIGIPPEHMSHMFTKFFQNRTDYQSPEQGTGLGLFITKQIITAHHGTITVDSVYKQGTTFTIVLPLTTFM